jgi:hypothetical protein
MNELQKEAALKSLNAGNMALDILKESGDALKQGDVQLGTLLAVQAVFAQTQCMMHMLIANSREN